MKQLKVGGLMSDDVVSAVPETSFRQVAELLAAHEISGVPVVDEDDHVLGVVSGSDLLADDARTARELMSVPAVMVQSGWTVSSRSWTGCPASRTTSVARHSPRKEEPWPPPI
ncbi:CBS domain-containing protein [Streptomyces sp. NPDC096079]|uniref:CBS domain-containing protein n=1 Tax=unclassified Streptomyces TaxID=2593676 RepID=UPI00333067A7